MRALVIALILSVPALAQPENKLQATSSAGAAEIADGLQQRVDLDAIDQTALRDVLAHIQDKLGHTILIDYKGILGPMGANDANGRKQFADSPITLPALKKVRLETVLRQVVDQTDTDFVIESDHVRVTGPASKDAAVGPRRVLPVLRRADEADEAQDAGAQAHEARMVTAAFKDVPLVNALQAVSLRTGRAVAINPEAADKAKAPVSLVLTNAPFETAVLALAEAAGLRAFRAGNAAVVVTPDRAMKIDEANAPGPFGGPIGFDPTDGVRRDLARAAEERKALEEKVRALTEELEKLKKK